MELRQREQHLLDLVGGTTELLRENAAFIIENGMWLSVAADIFFVTGRVCPEDKILWAQREGLIKILETVTADKWDMDAGFFDVDIPNPLALPASVLKPFVSVLKQKEPDKPLSFSETESTLPVLEAPEVSPYINYLPKESEKDKPQGWKPGCYRPMPLHWRIFIALITVGLLKTLLELGKGILGKV